MDDMNGFAKKAGALFHAGMITLALAIGTAGVVAANDLGEYPDPFISEDGDVDTAIVVNDGGGSSDMIAATNIAGSLNNAALDLETSELDDISVQRQDSQDTVALYSDANIEDRKTETNLVLVGGPEVNDLTQELAEKGETPGPEEFEEGEAIIQLLEDTFTDDQNILVVAGYINDETLEAANYISEYHQHEEELEGQDKIEIDTSEEVSQEEIEELLSG